jgi:hypothetical protein
MKIFIRIVKILVIISPCILIGWLLWKNFVPSGNFSAVYAFERTPWISALRPGHRISEIREENGVKIQSLTDDPVYFDITFPITFEKVIIEVDYKNTLNQQFKIGAFTSKKDWKFALKDFDGFWQGASLTGLSKVPFANGDWQTGIAEFNLSGLDKSGRKIMMILSLPEIRKKGGEVMIREIRVIMNKKPVNVYNLMFGF